MGDGGEVGFYEQAGSHPDLDGQWWANPLDPNLPMMSESVSGSGSTRALASDSPQQPQVWVGSWNPSVQDRNVNDLRFTATITFPSAGMYKAFTQSVQGNPLISTSAHSLTATISY